jgi:uncharacterized membrane protein YphA (DoxX/SURF4 family)
MNIVLWILQIVLAAVFLMAGVMKVRQPREKLATNMGWIDGFEDGHIKLIGTLEILGALGLFLPAVTGILPILTPLAALGLALTMVGAIITHLRRHEYPNLIVNIILLLMALFVAYGRIVLLPL